MSITLTITAIAASLFIGGAIGIREQRKQGIRPELTDDIDSCITVYADEEQCECFEPGKVSGISERRQAALLRVQAEDRVSLWFIIAMIALGIFGGGVSVVEGRYAVALLCVAGVMANASALMMRAGMQ